MLFTLTDIITKNDIIFVSGVTHKRNMEIFFHTRTNATL